MSLSSYLLCKKICGSLRAMPICLNCQCRSAHADTAPIILITDTVLIYFIALVIKFKTFNKS